jgi:predicted aspartyl protease
MTTKAIQEKDTVGRITIDVKLANRVDVEKCKEGAMSADAVRQLTIAGLVDTGSNYLVLPTSVAKKLGVPGAGKTKVRYVDRRVSSRDTVDMVEVELLGRKGTFRALLEPKRTTALIGAIVLEDLDLLVDSTNLRVFPRDPDGMTAEVE